MKHKTKLKHKIIAVVLAVTLLVTVLAVQASAFVNPTPDNSGTLYYAINPIADIKTELVASSTIPYDDELVQTPVHISVLSAGTPGTGRTQGLLTTSRPTSGIPDIYGLYVVETASSRIWTMIGRDEIENGYPYYHLEGVTTDVTVRFDTYIINSNMGSELNFEIENTFRNSQVDVESTYSGMVSYPKIDGSLGNAFFELNFDNSYNLTSAPDGNKDDHLKVRHFTSPTPLYANQNPQYVPQMAIYRDAYERLAEALKPQYVHPDNIERWITEEGYSFPPICSNYTSSYRMTLKGSDTPMLATALVAGTYASTDTWTGTYGNYLAVNSSLTALKATASRYDFTEVITNAINNTMNIQIFPDFTIGEIFLIVGGLAILVLLLKIFLGG